MSSPAPPTAAAGQEAGNGSGGGGGGDGSAGQEVQAPGAEAAGAAVGTAQPVERRVNMDVSAMLALCSEMCNTDQHSPEEMAKDRFVLPVLHEMQEYER